jgi:hypothetical protein
MGQAPLARSRLTATSRVLEEWPPAAAELVYLAALAPIDMDCEPRGRGRQFIIAQKSLRNGGEGAILVTFETNCWLSDVARPGRSAWPQL